MNYRQTITSFIISIMSLSLAISGLGTWVVLTNERTFKPNQSTDDAVCYIESTGVYYNDIEPAIAKANALDGEQRIVVVPDSTLTLNESMSLNANVDLLLPYKTFYETYVNESDGTRIPVEDGAMTEIREENGRYIAKYLYSNGKDSSGNPKYPFDSENKYNFDELDEYDDYETKFADNYSDRLSSTLIIDKNVTLTLKSDSQLVIYGQLGRVGNNLSGYTSGYYSQLILLENAKINVNDGAILDCRGYIKEGYLNAPTDKKDSNGSQIINHGKVYSPFVIYDYPGGSATIAMYAASRECPFTMYDMPNIHPIINTYIDGEIYGMADLYTGYENLSFASFNITTYPQHNAATLSVFSNEASSSPLLIMEDDSNDLTEPKIISKYHPNKYSNYNDIYIGVNEDLSSSGRSEANQDGGTTSIKIQTNSSFNYLSIGLPVLGKNVVIKTEGVYFPLPWQYDITFDNVVFNARGDIKLMQGSKVSFINNSNASISQKLILYKQSNNFSGYPCSQSPDAELLLSNSNLTLASSSTFGGMVSTTGGSYITVLSNSLSTSTTETHSAKLDSSKLGVNGPTLAVGAWYLSSSSSIDDILDDLGELCTISSKSDITGIVAKARVNNENNIQNLVSMKEYQSDENALFFNESDLPTTTFTIITKRNWGEYWSEGFLNFVYAKAHFTMNVYISEDAETPYSTQYIADENGAKYDFSIIAGSYIEIVGDQSMNSIKSISGLPDGVSYSNYTTGRFQISAGAEIEITPQVGNQH